MSFDADDFRILPGKSVDLKKWPTETKPAYESKEQYETLLLDHVERLSELQELLYAGHQHAVLFIFQGMDAAGKDGAIQHVMSGVNPQGCQAFGFQRPSAQELKHDFLWRTTRNLPERGRIGIFNRSYYEEVLIVRVHPELLSTEGVSDKADAVWEKRYQSIVDLEHHLHRNGTTVVKFFLHLSKEEQRKRFLKRIEEPEKNWKFDLADVQERAFWGDYQRAYEECLSATSTDAAPWYVVPADDKQNARLIISQVVIATLAGLHLRHPRVTEARLRELEVIRQQLDQ